MSTAYRAWHTSLTAALHQLQAEEQLPRPRSPLTIRLKLAASANGNRRASDDSEPSISSTSGDSDSSEEPSEPANLSPRFGVRPIPGPRPQVAAITLCNKALAEAASHALQQFLPLGTGNGPGALPSGHDEVPALVDSLWEPDPVPSGCHGFALLTWLHGLNGPPQHQGMTRISSGICWAQQPWLLACIWELNSQHAVPWAAAAPSRAPMATLRATAMSKQAADGSQQG